MNTYRQFGQIYSHSEVRTARAMFIGKHKIINLLILRNLFLHYGDSDFYKYYTKL